MYENMNSFNQTSGVSGNVTGQAFVSGLQQVPQEPSVIRRAAEMIGHIENLEFELSIMRGSLFGEGQNVASADIKPANPPLDSLVAEGCQRIANCLGQIRTINRKLGVEDPRSNSVIVNTQSQFVAGIGPSR